LYAGVNVRALDPPLHTSIQTRFSALRYSKILKKLDNIQRAHIARYHLEFLTYIPDHLLVPTHLLQWLAFRCASTQGKVFRKRDKVITFTKDLVDKIFGFPNGTIPFSLGSKNPEIEAEVEALRAQYRVNDNYPVHRLESVLLGTNDEVVFIRTLILTFITTVLCPTTSNFMKPKYLYSLRDVNIVEVRNLDFATLCLDHLWDEMDSWVHKLFFNPGDPNKLTWIGGCLPVLVVRLFYPFCCFIV
jgi:hypothetical protein